MRDTYQDTQIDPKDIISGCRGSSGYLCVCPYGDQHVDERAGAGVSAPIESGLRI